jgi:hypothetical protein
MEHVGINRLILESTASDSFEDIALTLPLKLEETFDELMKWINVTKVETAPCAESINSYYWQDEALKRKRVWYLIDNLNASVAAQLFPVNRNFLTDIIVW